MDFLIGNLIQFYKKKGIAIYTRKWGIIKQAKQKK